jgi:hypothetical protein
VSERPDWREVQPRVARELGEPVDDAEPLVPARRSGMTWAALAKRTGPIVVKIRHDDRACEKTQWCATHLPALRARGYPVPAILWHGMIGAQWHMTVENRLPGRHGPLCTRLRRWLEPVWGLRLPPADYAHNDLNLSNVLTDGARIAAGVRQLPWRYGVCGYLGHPRQAPGAGKKGIMKHEELISKAESVLKRKTVDGRLHGDVGAALISQKGDIYTGVCVDTAGGLCAERNAIAALRLLPTVHAGY